MQIAVTGSIATDNLMHFPGLFSEQLLADQLDHVSLSFLVDDLVVHRGGIAANISFGMAQLGLKPILVGAVGADFGDYRSWLERHGVDCGSVHVSDVALTARFICTTDEDMAQIATFYAGAMSEARTIELGPVVDACGGIDLVVVSPDDPEAMLRHSAECRTRGLPFAADPSQQLAFMDGASIRRLVDGATYLFTNEYEAALTERKTGWSPEEILQHVRIRVITRGQDGATVLAEGAEPIHVPIAEQVRRVDPTGVGDGFRAGFLAGLAWDLGHERCAQLGSMLAAYVLETVGTQEYDFDPRALLQRFTAAYGAQAAAEVARNLGQGH